jgi:hypothetical protein
MNNKKEKIQIKETVPKIPKILTSEWIIKHLNKLNNVIKKNVLDYRKNNLLLHDYSYYINMIYNTYDIDKFEPELEFCESIEQKDIWLGLRLKISSFEYVCDPPGRFIQILIKDKLTKKYIGITSLSSIGRYNIFDNHIGWISREKFGNKQKNIKCKANHIMDISTCVGIPPFSFNFNGGKLITMLMFSKEVYDYFYKKYNDELVCIITFSLYGKSIQYDRIKELTYIGLTKGEGVSHIPRWLSNCILEYMKKTYPNKNYNRRIYTISAFAKKYKVDALLQSKEQKGAYIGFTGENTKYFLSGIDDIFVPKKLKNVNEIYNFWKNRWATNRFNTLISTNRVMIYCNYDTSIIDNKDYNRIKQIRKKQNDGIIDNKKEKITFNEKIKIIQYYIQNKNISMLQLEKYFSNLFNKKIDRRTIANLLHC